MLLAAHHECVVGLLDRRYGAVDASHNIEFRRYLGLEDHHRRIRGHTLGLHPHYSAASSAQYTHAV